MSAYLSQKARHTLISDLIYRYLSIYNNLNTVSRISYSTYLRRVGNLLESNIIAWLVAQIVLLGHARTRRRPFMATFISK